MGKNRKKIFLKTTGTLGIFFLLILPTFQSICGKAETPQLSISNPILTELSNPLLLLQPPETPVQGGNNPDHVIDPNGPDDDEGSEDPDPCNPDTQFGFIYPENQSMIAGYDYTSIGGIESLGDCNCDKGPYEACWANPDQENATEQIEQTLTKFGPNMINTKGWNINAKASVYCEEYYSLPPPLYSMDSSCVFNGDFSANAQVSSITFHAESFTDHTSIYEKYKCGGLYMFISSSQTGKKTQPVQLTIPFGVNLQGMIIIPESTLDAKIQHTWNCNGLEHSPNNEEAQDRSANAWVSSTWNVRHVGSPYALLGSSLSLSETKYVSVEDPEMMYTAPYCGVYRGNPYIFNVEYDTHGYSEPLPPCTEGCDANTYDKIFAKGWFETILCYVPVDLGIDSNNDGTITMDDDCVELDGYGKLIPWNDQYHPDPNNLVEIRLNTQSACAEDTLNDYRWKLAYPDTVKIWKDKNRTELVQNMHNYELPAPTSLWVEGLEASTELGDVLLRLSTVHIDQPNSDIVFDIVVATIVQTDLDVDSNNNNENNWPELNTYEDQIERFSPGKVIWIAHNLTFNSQFLSTPLYDLFPIVRTITPSHDMVYSNFEITLSKKAGAGQIKIFALRPNAEYPPHFPDFIEVPFDTNIRDQFFFSSSPYSTYTWFMVGVEPGELDVELKMKQGNIEIKDTARITVVKIESVEWMPYTAELDSNPNPPGGFRIFPDQRHPGDMLTSNEVFIIVHILPKNLLYEVPVYIQVFDVDDPSSNSAPVDDEAQSFDNRGEGTPDLYLPQVHLSNPDDVAERKIEVTKQPGDNFRVVADLAQTNYLNTLFVRQNDAQAQVYQSNGQVVPYNQISELLTVWRHLWIERDSMATPQITEYTITGTADAITYNYPVTGVTTIDLGLDLPDDLEDEDLFEGGLIQFPSGTYNVLKSISNSFYDDEVIIEGTPLMFPGDPYVLYDDDIQSVLPHSIDGGSVAENAFADAYIFPMNLNEFYSDIIPFEMHITSAEIYSGEGEWDDCQDLAIADDFWYVSVVHCWEGDQDGDMDPDGDPASWSYYPLQPSEAESKLFGTSCYWCISNAHIAFLYMQTIQDEIQNNNGPYCAEEKHLMVHEIGHAFCNLDHEPSTIMDESPCTASQSDHFGPYSIDQLRDFDGN